MMNYTVAMERPVPVSAGPLPKPSLGEVRRDH